MAWDLGGNWRSELLRMRLSRTLPLERIQEFLPPYPGDAPPRIADLKALYSGIEKKLASRSPVLSDDAGSRRGSNSWAVSGARSASGKPLLANDPHLGLTAPPVWYFAHLHAPGHRRDRRHAARRAGDPRRPQRPHRLGPHQHRRRRAGPLPRAARRAASRSARKRSRCKGAADERLARAPLAPRPGDLGRAARRARRRAARLRARARLDRARRGRPHDAGGAHSSRARATGTSSSPPRATLHAPQQTVSYADVDGNIGFIAAGRVPVRKPRERPARASRRRRAGTRATTGPATCPSTSCRARSIRRAAPWSLANHKIMPPGYPHHITYEWQPPYRARRIEELLDGSASTTSRASSACRPTSCRSRCASCCRRFRAARSRPRGAEAARGLGRRPWPPSAPSRSSWSPGGASSRARCTPTSSATRFRAELERARRVHRQRARRASRTGATTCARARWRPATSSWPTRSANALAGPAARATATHWRWGEAHVARHRHRPFTREPWLARFFDIRVPSAGDAYTVNAGAIDFNDEAEPFANRHAREPARDQRPRRPAGVAVHPFRRPVGQPALAALPRFRRRLGARRVRADGHRARAARGRRRSAPGAHAAQVEVVRHQRADHHRRAGDLDRGEAAAERRLDARTRRSGSG